jgi:uncharacterized protein YbaR (Trm112 family)
MMTHGFPPSREGQPKQKKKHCHDNARQNSRHQSKIAGFIGLPQNQELISDKAGLAFPIRDGIPVMLPDEARQL